jgi:DNA-binding MarR family transcriptional regulator
MAAQRKSKGTAPPPTTTPQGRKRARPDDGASAPAFTLAILLQHTGRLLEDRLRRGFDDLGLHAAQGQVLHLLEWGDGVSQRELTRMMNVAAPTVSGILTRMEVKGLVERRIDAADERVTRVFLTRKGRGKGEAARASVQRVEQALIAGLSRAQLRSAHRLLRRLRENLGGEPPGAEPTVTQILP